MNQLPFLRRLAILLCVALPLTSSSSATTPSSSSSIIPSFLRGPHAEQQRNLQDGSAITCENQSPYVAVTVHDPITGSPQRATRPCTTRASLNSWLCQQNDALSKKQVWMQCPLMCPFFSGCPADSSEASTTDSSSRQSTATAECRPNQVAQVDVVNEDDENEITDCPVIVPDQPDARFCNQFDRITRQLVWTICPQSCPSQNPCNQNFLAPPPNPGITLPDLIDNGGQVQEPELEDIPMIEDIPPVVTNFTRSCVDQVEEVEVLNGPDDETLEILCQPEGEDLTTICRRFDIRSGFPVWMVCPSLCPDMSGCGNGNFGLAPESDVDLGQDNNDDNGGDPDLEIGDIESPSEVPNTGAYGVVCQNQVDTLTVYDNDGNVDTPDCVDDPDHPNNVYCSRFDILYEGGSLVWDICPMMCSQSGCISQDGNVGNIESGQEESGSNQGTGGNEGQGNNNENTGAYTHTGALGIPCINTVPTLNLLDDDQMIQVECLVGIGPNSVYCSRYDSDEDELVWILCPNMCAASGCVRDSRHGGNFDNFP